MIESRFIVLATGKEYQAPLSVYLPRESEWLFSTLSLEPGELCRRAGELIVLGFVQHLNSTPTEVPTRPRDWGTNALGR